MGSGDRQARLRIGVAIVTYDSAGVIGPCLRSVLASEGAEPVVVICDNASPDGTVATLRGLDLPGSVEFAPGEIPRTLPDDARVVLLRARRNRGFAAGVNRALRLLLSDPDLDLFWILNPDCEAAPCTAAAYLATSGADLIGGRTLFADGRTVQSDGGRVSPRTATCTNVNRGVPAADARPPAADSLDFVSGANMVVTRRFIAGAGLMPEDYFLFYEEVDWALRRGALRLATCPEAIVRHHGGTSTGSATLDRGPSALASYFTYRNRLRFARRHRPFALPGALAHGLAKAAQFALRGAGAEAAATFRGHLHLPPPAAVRARLATPPAD